MSNPVLQATKFAEGEDSQEDSKDEHGCQRYTVVLGFGEFVTEPVIQQLEEETPWRAIVQTLLLSAEEEGSGLGCGMSEQEASWLLHVQPYFARVFQGYLGEEVEFETPRQELERLRREEIAAKKRCEELTRLVQHATDRIRLINAARTH